MQSYRFFCQEKFDEIKQLVFFKRFIRKMLRDGFNSRAGV
jgi:hypothetical protein